MSNTIPGVKRVQKRLSSGVIRTYLYDNASGDRLPSDPAAARFEMEKRKSQPREEMNVCDYIREYSLSPRYTRLAEKTRITARIHLLALENEFGSMKRSEVEREGSRKLFYAYRDRIGAEKPCTADARITYLKIVFNYALDQEALARNPALGISNLYQSDREEVVWSPKHVKEFYESKAIPQMKLAVALALHTGQREGDLIDLTFGQYDGEVISLVPSKTKRVGRAGRVITFPVTSELRAKLDKHRFERLAKYPHEPIENQYILRPPRGSRYKENSFRLAWRRAWKTAGSPHAIVDKRIRTLHFHDLRGTCLTIIANNGGNTLEIAALTGHAFGRSERIASYYVKPSLEMARAAIDKLENGLLPYADASMEARMAKAAKIAQIPNERPNLSKPYLSLADDQPDDSWLRFV